ncbi:MAG: response regulator transcription factor [Verrucomicrobia bacterium]|nr:response regulator transcription factor [Verrucomicrobiota bacterium]
MSKKTRLLLVDDHPVVRRGLALLLGHEPDMVVCAEADDVGNALQAAAEHKPDLAVVDISLSNGNGLTLIKELQQRAPPVPVLVLSIHDENLYGERALRAGARGYVMKQEATERVLDAIRCVARGESYMSQNLQSRLLRQAAGQGRPNLNNSLID